MLSIIVTKAKNNIIGKDNRKPWKLELDDKHFDELTKEEKPDDNELKDFDTDTSDETEKSDKPVAEIKMNNIFSVWQRQFEFPLPAENAVFKERIRRQ